ncbi:unnamed protein product [Closterium sp. Naga37s-1]|nr:unnamed protein product [Closterium sp. Naga37s-1]
MPPLWPYELAQPLGPSCRSWPCSPASLRASLPTVPTDSLPFPSAPIFVPASGGSSPTHLGRLHAADAAPGVVTTLPSPCRASECQVMHGLLPPAFPLANGAAQATALHHGAPSPTAAAHAESGILPSVALPSAAAAQASGPPRPVLLPAPTDESPRAPPSLPLLPASLLCHRTARSSAAVPSSNVSLPLSALHVVAGLQSRACPLLRPIRAFPAAAPYVSPSPESGLPAAAHRGRGALPGGWVPWHAALPRVPPLPPPLLPPRCRRVPRWARAIPPRFYSGRGVPRASARRCPPASRRPPARRRAPSRRRTPAHRRALACHCALARRRAPARRRIPARRRTPARRRFPA